MLTKGRVIGSSFTPILKLFWPWLYGDRVYEDVFARVVGDVVYEVVFFSKRQRDGLEPRTDRQDSLGM
jgi:hypothetical protein